MINHDILIVEDEFLIALNLKLNLERAGYKVCGTPNNGKEAIQMVKKCKPTIVIMDINLIGDIDGIETARQISRLSSTPIIFTTGYDDSKLKQQSMTLNPVAYLTKPVSMRDIYTILKHFFENS